MKYIIKTEGMGCAHCIKKVTKAMQELGAEAERVELNDIVVESGRSASELTGAIEALGFRVLSIEPQG